MKWLFINMWYLATGDNLIKPYIEGGDNMDKKLTDEQLEELALEARRKYHREWRRNNPDKVREYRKRHWRKKALEMLKEQQEDA